MILLAAIIVALLAAPARAQQHFDAGGSVELPAGARTFARIDLGDRLLRYPGPSFRNGGTTQGAFFSHDFRLSAGAGVRF